MIARRKFLGGVIGLGAHSLSRNIASADCASYPSSTDYDFISRPTRNSSDEKLVIAHWHFFQRSMDNKPFPDYYTSQYMSPLGEKSKHIAYGGLLRDRPIYRPPIDGNTVEWRTEDHRHEIQTATRMGVNCFQVNSDARISRESVTELMLNAAKETPNFKVMLSVDCDIAKTKSDAEIANFFNFYGTHDRALRDRNGRLFVTAYRPESWGVERWEAILARIEQSFVFAPTFLDPLTISAFWQLVDGVFLWRGNDYRQFREGSTLDSILLRCRNEGKLFAVPISPQDHRSRTGVYWEARGSRTAIDGWRYAIDKNADAVYLISWNDFAEGHHWQPSLRTQFGYSTLCSFFSAWFQSRISPTIKVDVLTYFHRIERTDAVQCGQKQTIQRMVNRLGGQDETFDEIELSGFLTSPGYLDINGVSTAVGEGLQTVRIQMPTMPGRPFFSLIRNQVPQITLFSNYETRTTSDFQDLLYRSGTSNICPLAPPQ